MLYIMKSATVVLVTLGCLSCSVNILEEFGDQTTDDALFYQAKMLINDGDYQGAIDAFADMSPEFLARREVKGIHASAYAGVCGVNFLDILDAFGTLSATRFFLWAMQTFTGGSAARQSACISAETLLKEIGATGSARTDDENILMTFISLTKMGVILSRYADANSDDAVDGGFDPCDSAVDLPSADTKEIATGFAIAIDSLQNITSLSIGGDITSQVSTACGDLPAPQQPACNNPTDFDTADVDATEESLYRSLLKEDQSVGLGTCAGDITVCFCP